MNSGPPECIVKPLEALRGDHRKYLKMQFRTFLSFDLFVDVLLNRLSC